jgi:hypothetical protein
MVTIFDHMLASLGRHLPTDDRPLAAILLDEAEKNSILLDSPLRFVNFRVEMVDPLLPALLGSMEHFEGRLKKKTVADIFPPDHLLSVLRVAEVLVHYPFEFGTLGFFPKGLQLPIPRNDGLELVEQELSRFGLED